MASNSISNRNRTALGEDPFADMGESWLDLFTDAETGACNEQDTQPKPPTAEIEPSEKTAPAVANASLAQTAVSPEQIAADHLRRSATPTAAQITPPMELFDMQQQKVVAHVSLNGYHIAKESSLANRGDMRSFKHLDGDLNHYWSRQTVLKLRQHGQEHHVVIAALPTDDGSSGLIEFI